MLPSLEKNNFIDFLIKFHFIDFFLNILVIFWGKIYKMKFYKKIFEIMRQVDVVVWNMYIYMDQDDCNNN